MESNLKTSVSTTVDLTPAAHLIRDGIITILGQAGWARLADADRLLIEACCLDAAGLQLALLTAAGEPAAVAAVRREMAHVDAQLANIAAGQGVAIAAAIWDAASKALLRAGMALSGAL
jgi:hypothetical protein